MIRLSEDHDWAIKIYHERADAWFEKSDVVMKESLKCSQPVKANNMHKYSVVTFHNSVTKLPCTRNCRLTHGAGSLSAQLLSYKKLQSQVDI